MLEEEIARDIGSVLDWAIGRSECDGESLQADRFRVLKLYLSSKSETVTDMYTASDFARRGGLSRSPDKIKAAKANAKFGGGPGRYYACGVKSGADGDTSYLFFSNKEKRNQWVQCGQPGERLPLPATDTGLRRMQRQSPEKMVDGDNIVQSYEDREDLHEAFEKYHDLA